MSKSSSSDNSIVNIVPCRINHTGTSKVTKRYWQPRSETDGTETAYFRGRRLRGRVINMPEKYTGLVLRTSAKTIIEPTSPAVQDEDEDDEEPELPVPIKVIEQVSNFDKMILPPADDTMVKGVEEWIAFAEAIHKPA
ncbi:hypothetical protein LTR64_003389 [Lithohypha guttulata]|uniref:Uncharacterized protein n=1 Tax=Lithohypha guttulata TaxID=1690604 RepID=A0AAN7SZN5_9EURO|nr:hypothetical protein LTR51_000392 [Lithohypha guttulata]KAK5085581.1 hypothetical protein LTR05_004868 [Lithohypha guttulata]